MENMMAPPPRRPLGITIISILLIIEGVVELIGAFAAFSLAAVVRHHGVIGSALGVAGIVIGVIALALAIATLVLAWGLWTLKRWAYWATIFIQVLIIVERILSLLRTHATAGMVVASLIIPVIVLIYLFVDRAVRNAFHLKAT